MIKKTLAIGLIYSSPIIAFITLTSINARVLRILAVSYSLISPVASVFLLEKEKTLEFRVLQREIKNKERELNDKQYEITTVQDDLIKTRFDYSQELKDTRSKSEREIGILKSENNALLSALKKKEQDNEIVKQSLIKSHREEISRLESTVSNWQNKEKKLIAYSATLTEKENDLERGLKDFELERKSLELDRKNLENHLEAQRLQFDHAISQSESAINDLQRQIEYLSDENNGLRQQITILSNELSKPENQTARVILELFSQNKIRVDYVESINSNGVWRHIYKPLSSNFNEYLKGISEQLPGLIDIDSPPNYTVKNGKVTFLIDSRKAIDKVQFAPNNWLEKLALADENCLILGARGTGKSELAVNYCALLYRLRDDFSIRFIQPKPDEFSKIDLGDKVITPDYLGFEGSKYPTAYDGLIALNDEVMMRNRINTDRFENPPQWEPQFWVIDEFQQLINRADNFGYKAKDISLIIKNAVSLGRSLKIYVLAIGQIANVSQFPGWNKADFHQFNQVYLGDGIKVGIGYLAIDKGEENGLNNDYKTISNSPIKYYSLCYQDSKKFFAQLPQPREYCSNNQPQSATITATISNRNSNTTHNPQQLETLQDKDCVDCCSVPVLQQSAKKPENEIHPLCPNCNSDNVRKNGKYKGNQRYKCKDCQHNFSIIG